MKDRISFLGLETEAHTINQWLDTIMCFYKEASSDHHSSTLVTAARDFSLALAQVYISKRVVSIALFNIIP